jgi:ligand-binding sensor domain-containing protein
MPRSYCCGASSLDSFNNFYGEEIGMNKRMFSFMMGCCIFLGNSAYGQWTKMSGPEAGSIRATVVYNGIIFAGTDGGGIFRSLNNGATWTGCGMAGQDFYAFAVRRDSLFAGAYGDGVYLSTDSGTSWKAINSGMSYLFIDALASNNAALFAATYQGIYRLANGDTAWTPVNAALKYGKTLLTSGDTIFVGSSDSGVTVSFDNGTSWAQSNSGMAGHRVYALAKNGADVYAGTYDGVFRSADNGASWNAVNSGLTDHDVISLALHNGDVFAGTLSGVYRLLQNGAAWTAASSGLTNRFVRTLVAKNDTLFAGTYGGGVFRSSNNGATWTVANAGLSASLVTSFTKSGKDLVAGTYGAGAFLLANCAGQWTAINTGLTSLNVRCLATRCDTLLFAGTDLGVFRTSNLLMSWTQVNNGITVRTDIYALAVNGINGPDIFAGISTGFSTGGWIYHSINDGNAWTLSANQSDRVYALAANNGTLFAGIDTGVFLSTDNGDSWTVVNAGLTNKCVISFAFKDSSVFAGTYDGVFRSFDSGTSWTQVVSGLTPTAIYALAVGGDSVFAGTNDGVFVSANDGTSWSRLGTGLPGMAVNALVASDTCLFAGTQGLGVWRFHLLPGMSAAHITARRTVCFSPSLHMVSIVNSAIPTAVAYSIPSACHVRLSITALSGRSVAVLENGQRTAGEHSVAFDGTRLRSGFYVCRFQTGNYQESRRLLLVK